MHQNARREDMSRWLNELEEQNKIHTLQKSIEMALAQIKDDLNIQANELGKAPVRVLDLVSMSCTWPRGLQWQDMLVEAEVKVNGSFRNLLIYLDEVRTPNQLYCYLMPLFDLA